MNAGGKGRVALAPQIICRGLRGSNKRLVTAAFWGQKHCKLEAKGAHFNAQAVHFSHQCLLLFLAHCQRH